MYPRLRRTMVRSPTPAGERPRGCAGPRRSGAASSRPNKSARAAGRPGADRRRRGARRRRGCGSGCRPRYNDRRLPRPARRPSARRCCWWSRGGLYDVSGRPWSGRRPRRGRPGRSRSTRSTARPARRRPRRRRTTARAPASSSTRGLHPHQRSRRRRRADGPRLVLEQGPRRGEGRRPDDSTDLALLKVPVRRRAAPLPLGTSSNVRSATASWPSATRSASTAR